MKWTDGRELAPWGMEFVTETICLLTGKRWAHRIRIVEKRGSTTSRTGLVIGVSKEEEESPDRMIALSL